MIWEIKSESMGGEMMARRTPSLRQAFLNLFTGSFLPLTWWPAQGDLSIIFHTQKLANPFSQVPEDSYRIASLWPLLLGSNYTYNHWQSSHFLALQRRHTRHWVTKVHLFTVLYQLRKKKCFLLLCSAGWVSVLLSMSGHVPDTKQINTPHSQPGIQGIPIIKQQCVCRKGNNILND